MDLKTARAEIDKTAIDPSTKMQWELYTYLEGAHFMVKKLKGKIYLIKKAADNKSLFLLIEREKINSGVDNAKYYLHVLKGIGRYLREEKSEKFEQGGWCFIVYNDKELEGLKSYNKAMIDKCRLLLALDSNIIKV